MIIAKVSHRLASANHEKIKEKILYWTNRLLVIEVGAGTPALIWLTRAWIWKKNIRIGLCPDLYNLKKCTVAYFTKR